MDKILFDLFFNDCEGIFACIRDNENCDEKKEEALTVLRGLNEKFKNNQVSNLEMKLLNFILIELAKNIGIREYSDLFMDIQSNMKDTFLTLEEYNMLKGE